MVVFNCNQKGQGTYIGSAYPECCVVKRVQFQFTLGRLLLAITCLSVCFGFMVLNSKAKPTILGVLLPTASFCAALAALTARTVGGVIDGVVFGTIALLGSVIALLLIGGILVAIGSLVW